MSTPTQTIENLTYCFDELEGLLADLTPAEWETQSLCPDWTVRGVVTHLAGLERMLDGWMPATDNNKPHYELVGSFASDAAGWSNDELRAETGRILANRRSQLAALSSDQLELRSMTPIGEATYQRFMEIRVFDFWVHVRDIAVPLGRPTVDTGPAAEMALDEVHHSIGYIVGKKVGLPDQMSIAFHLTGPIERDICAVVDGRARRVDHLAAPSVEITTDSLTLVLLACGRIDPQGVIDAGKISWSGDTTWGEHAARNLSFTF